MTQKLRVGMENPTDNGIFFMWYQMTLLNLKKHTNKFFNKKTVILKKDPPL